MTYWPTALRIALNATLLGLITAIPSLVAWSYYNKKVESHAVKMASLCDGFLRQLYHLDETGGTGRNARASAD